MVSVSCGLARVGSERTATVIIDCAIACTERDMMELRFRTVAPAVDHIAIVAAERTHQGERADVRQIAQAFEYARKAYAGRLLNDAITLHWVKPSLVLESPNGHVYERSPDDRGPAGTRFFAHIERQHRNGCLDAAREITQDPDAIILISDVDELPTPDAIRRSAAILAERSAWLTLAMRFHSTALDLLHPYQPWWGSSVSRLSATSPQAQRDARTTIGTPEQAVEIVPMGGFHLSWIATDEERQRKLETFSHAEHRQWDAVAGRREQRHINGEPLVRLSVADQYRLDWPAPLLTGEFVPPASWLSEHAWES